MLKKKRVSHIGFAVSIEWLEIIKLGKNLKYTENSQVSPVPSATIDPTGDRLINPESLSDSISALIKYLDDKSISKGIHLSIPGSLVRIIEMPNLTRNQLLQALMADTERYTVFSGTEAVLDYEILETTDEGRIKVLVVAVRKDTIEHYKNAFAAAKVKILSIETSYIASLRGLAVTGVLDSLIEECNGAPWGSIHFSPERVHISIWQNKTLKNLREILIDTSDLKVMGEEAPIIQDLVDDVRRTCGILKPVTWLTYGIPGNISTSLSTRLGHPVKPMLPGDYIELDNPKVSLASIGVAAKSFENFPAVIHIETKESSEEDLKTSLTPNFFLLIIISIVVGFIMVGITIALSFATMYFEGQLGDVKKAVQATLAQNTIKRAELENKKKEGELRDLVYEKICELHGINLNYATLTGEIKQKTPTNLWFDKILLDQNNIEIEGKALSYDSILYLIENFSPHLTPEAINKSSIQNLSLKKIEEDRVDGTIIYKFSIQGSLNNDYFKNLYKERKESEISQPPSPSIQPNSTSTSDTKH